MRSGASGSEDRVQPAIETSGLTCRYGRFEAVHDLTFRVPSGTIFALLGPNGSGKTSTIRMLMNIIEPARGRASVLGMDSRRLVGRAFASIGYVSENQKLPRWMTVRQMLEYCRPFYPAWDAALCAKLVEEFALPLDVRIGRLSRGMRVKAALVSALAYRPALLVLDEPFSGLDPVVRDDLVRGVLERAGDEQWTVFLSSHDLDEVERLVDHVGFLDAGRLVVSEPFTELHGRFRRVEVTLTEAAEKPVTPETWFDVQLAGRVAKFVETRYVPEETERQAASLFRAARIDVQPMTLREIFVLITRHERRRKA